MSIHPQVLMCAVSAFLALWWQSLCLEFSLSGAFTSGREKGRLRDGRRDRERDRRLSETDFFYL